MITEMITNYNEYMKSVFDNNQFLIGMVTTGLMGFAGYLLKLSFDFSKEQFRKHLTTTIELDSTHNSYYKIMGFINEQQIIKKSRYLMLSNGPWGYEKPILGLGSGYQIIKLFGKFCLVAIKTEQNKERIIYKMWITTFGRSHFLANKLFEISNHNKNDDITEVLVAGEKMIYRQPKEYMKYRFYIEAEQKVYNIVKTFIENEKDYIEKNIPYKLGLLLYGPPGTGKTSIVRAIAGEFGYKICIVNSFSDFEKLPSDEKIIIMIDEIDMIVGKKRNADNDEKKSLEQALNNFSLSTALKKLDGIIVRKGAIVIATTNYPEKLDPALLRHGRLGYKIEFGYIKPVEFESAVKKYYNVDYKLKGQLKQCTSADLMGAYVEKLTCEQFIDRFVEKGE